MVVVVVGGGGGGGGVDGTGEGLIIKNKNKTAFRYGNNKCLKNVVNKKTNLKGGNIFFKEQFLQA